MMSFWLNVHFFSGDCYCIYDGAVSKLELICVKYDSGLFFNSMAVLELTRSCVKNGFIEMVTWIHRA